MAPPKLCFCPRRGFFSAQRLTQRSHFPSLLGQKKERVLNPSTLEPIFPITVIKSFWQVTTDILSAALLSAIDPNCTQSYEAPANFESLRVCDCTCARYFFIGSGRAPAHSNLQTLTPINISPIYPVRNKFLRLHSLH